jgi:hypothetical protein
MYIIAEGNPFDGLTIYGPFTTTEDAMAFAETYSGDDIPWELVKVHKPKDHPEHLQ